MYLHAFRSASGGACIAQEKTLEWLSLQYAKHSGTSIEVAQRRIARFACSPSSVSQRRTFLPEWMDGQPPQVAKHRDIGQRMSIYRQQMAIALESVLSTDALTSFPTHLLHVTCTGYSAPSIAETWVSRRLGENPSLAPPVVQHLYHMGCYASIPALRTAQGLLAVERNASIAIAHTEFCTLHLNEEAACPEQWIIQSLFADAVVKYEATLAPPRGRPSLELLTTLERIAPDSIDDMTWNLGPRAFQMALSRAVPTKLRDCLRPFVNDLLERAGLPASELPRMIAAIHPGGPSIIDHVMQSLNLDESQATHSRKTLYDHGNVSSATLPLLWKRILEQPQTAEARTASPHVLCLAFGPGLTLAGAVLRRTEAGP